MMMLINSNSKSEKLYYYLLSKAGSYWGKKVYVAIMAAENQNLNRFELDEELKQINSIRRQHVTLNEKKENLKMYGLAAIPHFFEKWIDITLLIPYLTVPIISFIFYMPLYLIGSQGKELLQEVPRSKQFIITKEFIDQNPTVLPPPDIIPPSAPSGLGVS